MEICVAIILGLLVMGVGLAIYEKRSGKTVLEHDLGPPTRQTKADRDVMRARDVLRGKGMDGARAS